MPAPVTDPSAKAPSWQRRKAFREGEILQAAIDLISEGSEGDDDISMTSIGKRAGVSEATVYKYFDNRRHLIGKALHDAMLPLVEMLEAQIRFIAGCEGRLSFFVARILEDMIARPRLHLAAHVHMRGDAEYKTYSRDIHRRFAAIVRSVLEDGVLSGEIRADADLVLASDMIYGGLESVGQRTILMGRELKSSIADYAAQFARQVIAGVGVSDKLPGSVSSELLRVVERIDRRMTANGYPDPDAR